MEGGFEFRRDEVAYIVGTVVIMCILTLFFYRMPFNIMN